MRDKAYLIKKKKSSKAKEVYLVDKERKDKSYMMKTKELT